ncbi:hypothetical protein K469DRAFT_719845 [Zopfia rhizophila CBS 207.26]|uniref:Uncharacterized protein n=1 Tax=Zopfia rhizophila CBS 207.26 TaxID=1314779 RepID=A0A6A6DGX4_9PEZI|nr:hypothetical protein K469DRAFT_719845 [Zopfia rhizophila CBS 207.26]
MLPLLAQHLFPPVHPRQVPFHTCISASSLPSTPHTPPAASWRKNYREMADITAWS